MNQDHIVQVLRKHGLGVEGWLSLLAMPVLMVACLILFATGLAERKASWTETLIALTAIGTLYPGVLWLLNRHVASQYVAIQENSLKIRGVFSSRTISLGKIAEVRSPDWSTRDWSNEGNVGTFLKRKFEPVGESRPNVEVIFRQPVRLNAFPLPWYRILSLTVDRPDLFVEALSDKVRKARS